MGSYLPENTLQKLSAACSPEVGYLILGSASRLDAFSVYPIQT